ncbi:MAG: FtsX-like permease family protein [Mycobacteriales bacterium]
MRTTMEATRPGSVGTAESPRVPPRSSPSGPRRRSGGGTILLPPWTRAPLLPFRQPAVILAVVGAAAILACASASAALFLSSASSESLRRIVAAECADAADATVRVEGVGAGAGHGEPLNPPPPPGVSPPVRSDEEAAADPDGRVRLAMTGAGLADPARVRLSDQAPSVSFGIQNQRSRLFYRDGALGQVSPVGQSIGGSGVWLPSALATRLGATVGDRVRVASGGSPPVGSRVVGIYRNLFDEPTRPYWCSYDTLFRSQSYGGDVVPPPLVLATDAATFGALRDGYFGTSTDSWISPVATHDLTLSKGRAIADSQSAAYRAAGVPEPTDFAVRNSGTGQMPEFVARTTLIRDGLRGPVLPIALGGSLLALLLVGAAGSYWADRRVREVRLLSSRGVGPGALALKAALELALPALVGTVLGWLVARWLVRTLGPSPLLDSSAPVQAAATAAVALVAGMALLALVAGLRSRAATERPVGARRSWLAVVPWELALLGAALACYLRLRSGGAVTLDDGIAQINLLVVAFPLLFLVGTAVLVVRVLAAGLPRLGRGAGRLGPAWYLAARRVTASRVISVVLLAAASTPIAVLVYAAGLTQTSQYTLDAKASLFNGSDVAVQSVDRLRRTQRTDAVGTVVVRYLYGKVAGQSDDVSVLAVDTDTFAGTAFWDPRFADRPLDELLAVLHAPTADGRVPAIVIPTGPGFDPTFDVRLGRSTAKLRVVAQPRYFPGRRVPVPMVVVDRSRLTDVDPFAGTTNELWSRAAPDAARDAVLGQRARIYTITSRDTVFQAANFLGVSWTFGYLTALAALVGLVAVGGLLLYLETRQRGRMASYALGRRMGLSRGTHLRSLLAELGVLLGLAWAVGAGLAWLAVLMVYGRLDIDPGRLPGPLLTVPTVAFAGSAVAVGVVVVLASLYAQRSADRADVAEVLRLGS